jgi:cellulose synthase/poly-beta-1,6-N-acetylglucosamine synthase-like glycosyltransferase
MTRPLDERRGLEPILVGRKRVDYVVWTGLWLACLLFFWTWWLQPGHVQNPYLFILITATLGWATVNPAFFIFHYAGAARPSPTSPLPANLRVAMVVTKAPSEPFSILKRTLLAMLDQDLPHDTWLADEDPSPETYAWCAAHGVRVSTRRGCAEYHRTTWPRRTRCKEGNLAYFYDHYGYAGYDVVSQLDADHVPTPSYLREVVRPFGDERVGYVSAPSICDSNAAQSWASRGRLFTEGTLHGALQAGYTARGSSICIGSHYAVRTKALQQIGGLGPELAEDYSTSMMMIAYGWRGAHAIDAIAHGEGPRTFADLATQEFQWARSLVMILLKYSPTFLPRIPPRLRLQFIFAQVWCPLFSIFMAIGYLMPLAAILFHTTYANVAYPDFLLHSVPLSLVLVGLAYTWRTHGTSRPVDAKILSWEVVAFLFARWPWSLWGCIAAVQEWATNRYVDFRVTPKGTSEADPVPMRVLMPYAVLAAVSALPALVVGDAGDAAGFYVFSTISALIYAGIFALILVQHRRENKVRRASSIRVPLVATALLLAFGTPAFAVAIRGLDGLAVLSYGTPYFSLTDVTFSPAGAGHGPLRSIKLAPRWLSQSE